MKDKRVFIGLIAAAILLALVLILTQCHKKDDGESSSGSAASGSGAVSSVILLEDGWPDEVMAHDHEEEPAEPDVSGPYQGNGEDVVEPPNSLVKWADYLVEHPEAANVSHPEFTLDSNWWLYEHNGHPVVGVNDIDSKYEKARAQASDLTFASSVRFGEGDVYFETGMQTASLEKIMAADWEDEFEVMVRRNSKKLGAEAPVVRTYRDDKKGVLYMDITIDEKDEIKRRRFISAWLYFDYGDGTVAVTTIDETTFAVMRDDLDSWANDTKALINEYLSQYGTSLEATVFSDKGKDRFESAYIGQDSEDFGYEERIAAPVTSDVGEELAAPQD